MVTDNPLPAQAALDAVLSGLSATQGLKSFREAGGRVANQTWYRLVGEVQATLADREGIYNEPTALIPTGSEIKTWTTQKAKGYIQQVEVLVRDRETGEIISVPFSVTSRRLVSRRQAMKIALDTYSGDAAQRYNQQVLGAVYSGTYQAVPVAA